MDGELWPAVYRLVHEEGNRQPRPGRVQYGDGHVLEVFCWAAIHDRPACWACDERNWPAEQRGRELISESRLSERLRTLSVRLLMAAVLARLRESGDDKSGGGEPPSGFEPLARRLDAKPLPVGACSKDRDARWGQAGEAKVRGYKMFCGWGCGVVPDAWTLGPMNLADAGAAVELLPRFRGAAYLLGDALYDSNPLHAACAARGVQLVAPRKRPRTGLGHRDHHPQRTRSIEMLEWPVDRGRNPSPFARDLYRLRGDIERRYGNLTSFGGGLQPLPSWARTPHRVALWVAAKLVINGVRALQLKRLAA